MRHRVYGKKFSRDIKERNALFKNLVISLIIYDKIKTTVAKAKAVRSMIEKLVTKAKTGTQQSIRQIAAVLVKKEIVDKLVKDIAPRFTGRNGGYVRIRRVAKRSGDSTEEAILEWTVAKELKNEKKETVKKQMKTGKTENKKKK